MHVAASGSNCSLNNHDDQDMQHNPNTAGFYPLPFIHDVKGKIPGLCCVAYLDHHDC